MRGDHVEVEMRDRLRRAVAALEHLDDVDLVVCEERVEIVCTRDGVTGDVVVSLPDARRELHAISL